MPAVNIAQNIQGRAGQGTAAWKGWKCGSDLWACFLCQPQIMLFIFPLALQLLPPTHPPRPVHSHPLHNHRKIMRVWMQN